jgi:hypothetical protein
LLLAVQVVVEIILVAEAAAAEGLGVLEHQTLRLL